MDAVDQITGEIYAALSPTRGNSLATVDLKAVALSRFGEWREGAVALVRKYQGVVFDVSTTAGMKEAIAARMEVRAPRYAAQNVAKASKSELAAVSKAVGEEEAAIIKYLAETEEHIDRQIRVEEERKALAKAETERLAAEAAAAEVARIRRHREAIEVIHQYPIHAAGLPAERIEKGIKALQEMVFGDPQEECLPDYQAARDAALAKMLAMLEEAWRAEAEAVKIKAQLAEIERREKELAERERLMAAHEAKRLAEEQAAAAERALKIEEAARRATEILDREFAAAAAAAAEAARIDDLAKRIGEELTTPNQAAAAPGEPTAADQASGNAQAPAEPAAPPAAFQPDIPGIPVPPTDEEAAEKEPHLITLGEVCRRIGMKVAEADLARIGYVPSAKRGNAVYFKERNLPLICYALADYFRTQAAAIEFQLETGE